MGSLNEAIGRWAGLRVRVDQSPAPNDPGQASVVFSLSDGSRIEAFYWRLIKNGRSPLSSFDHAQRYGLPAPVDAIERLVEELTDAMLMSASLDVTTGDLVLEFDRARKLQILNVTGYEIWTIRLSNGAVEYSNYNR